MKKRASTGKVQTKKQLEQAIAAYQKLAEEDWLTGLYNRGAIEMRVDAQLKKNRAGSMIVMDIDQFKKVNDTYGHIIGDQLLREISSVLKKMMPPFCLLGRTGGDEFVIFFPQTLGKEELERRCSQIRERFSRVEVNSRVLLRLSMSICSGTYHPGFGYRELFDLADQQMVKEKRSRDAGKFGKGTVTDTEGDEIRIDMKILAKEMREEDPHPGAYCQDYETFKSIYRFVERRMTRKDMGAFLILFTLTDTSNEFPTLEKRDYQLEVLGQEIQNNLRMGDLYAQYSSCQYLVMLSDTTEENVEMIAERICRAFYSENGTEEELILHHTYPLKPAGK